MYEKSGNKHKNTYGCSDGERITQSVLDRRIREAKRRVLEAQVDEYGYNFCMTCNKNSSNRMIDCAHTISVEKCKVDGMAEYAYADENIKPTCRTCHQKQDGLNLNFQG